VVPIDVVALCVGEVDAQEATYGFSGATTVYSQQATPEGAQVAQNIARDFRDSPAEPLGEGVHLHWALPDALTRASSEGGGLSFPAAPNRWLITRLALEGAAPTAKSWLLESDALSAQKPDQGLSVTVPVKTTEFQQGFAYLGVSTALEEGFAPQARPLLRDHADAELTAVANGEAAFAAYYPSCGGALGFHDSLADLDPHPPAAHPLSLAYAVIGWYDLPANDPVQPGATAASLRKSFGWGYEGDAAPSWSIYSGFVQGIAWSSEETYVKGTAVQEPIAAEVTIGGDSAEALAARAAQHPGPGGPLFEDLLNAFQRGLLDAFAQPEAGQLARLEEQLHDAPFAGVEAGTVYSVAAAGGKAEGEGESTPPPRLAGALEELNRFQRRADLCSAHVAWFRWQLFADWYRIFLATEPEPFYHAAKARYIRWTGLEEAQREAAMALEGQLRVVGEMLGSGQRLKAQPAPRYAQPADPVLVLSAKEGLKFPDRHGGDGRFHLEGLLVCRGADRILTNATVAGTALTASQFASIAVPDGLAHAATCTALLREACLLWTDLAAALTPAAGRELKEALAQALAGEPQTTYAFGGPGLPPSPVAVNWREPNLWLPLFLSWKVEYLPVHQTEEQGETVPYDPGFFAANYRLEQNAGGAIAYEPVAAGHPVDPEAAHYPQSYSGQAHLTPSAARTLEAQLAAYTAKHPERALEEIEEELRGADFLTAPLAGLTDLLRMRTHLVQMKVAVSPQSVFAELTERVRPVIGDASRVGPDLIAAFNPIRAGYLRVVEPEIVDAFGQRRRLQFPKLLCSRAMTATVGGAVRDSAAYLQPRLAQPSRLLFQWLAGDGSGKEAGTRPATSPVCGWLLPNHLDGSLFLYDPEGSPLGTLFREEEGVGWQSAPGDDATIEDEPASALRFQNPALLTLAEALHGRGAQRLSFFESFWRAVDEAAAAIDPGAAAADPGLATLIGRPIALSRASLRLEVQGRPALDLGDDVAPGTDSTAGWTEVKLPVLLGDLENLGDGLLGYFVEGAAGYDFDTFYSQAAPAGPGPGVVAPVQGTLEVTATPRLEDPEPPPLAAEALGLLMLVDPRAPVHAATGYLPTATLRLPPDFSRDAIASLQASFLTAPVLRESGGPHLPVPVEAGYQVAWVEETRSTTGRRSWTTVPEIEPSSAAALWSYTPQSLSEGWLRLNPLLLDFELLDGEGHPAVVAGQANEMTLRVVNRSRRAIAFSAGPPAPEDSPPLGSVFYLRPEPLVAEADVPAMRPSAPGWSFQLFSSAETGSYWAGAPQRRTELGDGEALTVEVANLIASAAAPTARVYFEYRDLEGLGDGVSAQALSVRAPGRTGGKYERGGARDV
jgi:hypothetical protein